MVAEDVFENNPMHQKRGGHAKGNQIGQRIEFPAERALDAAHPRHPPVEQVEDAGQENETERDFDRVKIPVREVGLHDLGQGYEPAEEIAGRQEVREEIDFELRLG